MDSSNFGGQSSDSTAFSGPPEYLMTMCDCWENAVLKTAYTKANLGRRFWTCAARKCKFFSWHDDEICDRGKGFSGKMMVRVRSLEDELEKAKTSSSEKITKLEKEFKKIQKEKKAVEKELLQFKKVIAIVVLSIGIAGWMKCFNPIIWMDIVFRSVLVMEYGCTSMRAWYSG